jgi:hypothetical protein
VADVVVVFVADAEVVVVVGAAVVLVGAVVVVVGAAVVGVGTTVVVVGAAVTVYSRPDQLPWLPLKSMGCDPTGMSDAMRPLALQLPEASAVAVATTDPPNSTVTDSPGRKPDPLKLTDPPAGADPGLTETDAAAAPAGTEDKNRTATITVRAAAAKIERIGCALIPI